MTINDWVMNHERDYPLGILLWNFRGDGAVGISSTQACLICIQMVALGQ